ncbi:MAG TPA: ATP synthase F1 subunit gamma [Clostridia bacterium]|nr:ATP synthase F1 subunit gamma [Clostridia bacterium]
MANVLDIRRRIRSVTNTRQITKAMKMVSAAKLRRAQDRALTARPYAQMLTNVLKSVVSRSELFDPETGEARHPLLARRPERNILVIVVTGDKGLAGAFNTNILKTAFRFIESKADCNIDIEAIGRKGRDIFRRRYPAGEVGAERNGPVQVVGEQVGLLNKFDFSQVRAIAAGVIDRYTRGEIDAVYLLYNEFKSVIVQRLVVDEILPIGEIGERKEILQADEPTAEQKKRAAEAAESAGVSAYGVDTREIDRRAATFGTAPVDYIYEQPAGDLFRSLLPKYVAIQVFRAMLESVAAEHAARMTAMDSATNNATDMIDSLTLTMNRVRQASITKEIIEIVSGAAAL